MKIAIRQIVILFIAMQTAASDANGKTFLCGGTSAVLGEEAFDEEICIHGHR